MSKLDKLDPQKLTPEQRARLEKIREKQAANADALLVLNAQEQDVDRLLDQEDWEAEQKAHEALVRKRTLEADKAFKEATRKYGHGTASMVPTPDGPVVIRTPTKEAFKLMMEVVKNVPDEEKEAAGWSIMEPFVVYPAKEEFDKLLTKFGGLPGVLGKKMGEMFLGEEIELGKDG